MRAPEEPTATIVWQDSSTWLEVVRKFLRIRLQTGTISAWKRRNDLDSLYADDSEWQAILESSLKQDFDLTCEEFADSLESFNVEVSHACRPLDVAEYLDAGVFTATWARREEQLCRLMRELEVKRLDYDRLLAALHAEMSLADIDIGALFLALDQRHLLEFCGHYLILGSEWIASQLGHGHYAALRQVGTPTLLRIRLPLGWASAGDRKALARELLREWTRLKALQSSSVRNIDFTFRVSRSIPPSHVVSHSHPTDIPDPHHPDGWGQVWKNPITRCPYCT